jgi:hypothetical protein
MYDGKVAALEANLQELQATILRKEDNLRVVRDVLTVVSVFLTCGGPPPGDRRPGREQGCPD